MIKNDLKELKIEIKKFDQCKEVRNLNVPHNRDNFINLTVLDVLINNKLINLEDKEFIFSSKKESLKENLMKKIKRVYQFEFLSSNYFKVWLSDPIKIFNLVHIVINLRIRSTIQTRIAKSFLITLKISSSPMLRTMKGIRDCYFILPVIFYSTFKITL